jgi:hypothetical protein
MWNFPALLLLLLLQPSTSKAFVLNSHQCFETELMTNETCCPRALYLLSSHLTFCLDLEKKTVKCGGSSAIFYIEGGKKWLYSYQAWTYLGSPGAITVACGSLAAVSDGPNIPGTTVKVSF